MTSDIHQFFRERGISEVEAIIPDMAGIARGKIMPAREVRRRRGHAPAGEHLPADGDRRLSAGHFRGDEPGGDRHRAQGRPATVRVVPWAAEPTAQVIHDCFYSDGRRVTMAPRHVLRHVLELYAQRGWEPVVAPELEFYLIEPNIDADYPLKPPVGRSGRAEPGRQSYSIAAVNEFDPLFDDIYASSAKRQDIEIDTLIHEDGPAQMEINLLHGDPLDLADQAFLFKRTAREAALRHKMYTTFMAKPHAKEPGSAMHIHQSIVDTQDPAEHLQQSGRHAVAAVLLAYRRPAEIPAGGDGAVRAEREFLSAHHALSAGAHQRAVGLRQPHRRPARAGVGPGEPPRREPRGRRRCQSLPRHRGLAGLRLPRHGRGPAAHGAHRGQRARPAVRAAAFAGRRAAPPAECEPLIRILGEPFVAAFTIVKKAEYEVFLQVISSWEREHLLLNV